MANLSKEICLRFRDARREMNLTQTVLAREIGCKQSALSMFEAGFPTKLSEEFVQKLAKRLNVSLEPPPTPSASAVSDLPPNMGVHGFCPSFICPTNVPYVVEDRIFMRPNRLMASPGCGTHCAFCGELLEMSCPACGSQLNEGACCAVCGSSYVTPALPEGTDISAWVAMRRRELAELRQLFLP